MWVTLIMNICYLFYQSGVWKVECRKLFRIYVNEDHGLNKMNVLRELGTGIKILRTHVM